ncbi:hypothetical protein N182_28145 [Sinorhizobium sp. GL2]|nr:hypothetical protein N182_28145 [Sinorhizobium sp. GL2]
MLDEALKSKFADHLNLLIRPVAITANLDDGPRSQEMRFLLQGLIALNAKLSVSETRDGGSRTPSITLCSKEVQASIGFAGVPGGHEFTSFVLALLQVGGHPPRIDEALSDRIVAIRGDVVFKTYYSASCHICPDVVQALNTMAILNPRIKHVAIDGVAFPSEVESRGIVSVPAIYLNGELFAQGRISLDEIVSKLEGNVASESEAFFHSEPYDTLVIGGGPAGTAAAIYAARKGIRTGMVTERMGGQVLDTSSIENFISVRYLEGPQFAEALGEHAKDYEIDVIPRQRARKLIPGDEAISVEFSDGGVLRSRTVILCTGARWRKLGIPGEDAYPNKGVAYCPHCDGPLFKGRPVAVVGGGNSGVEAAIDLANTSSRVTLIEAEPALRADDVLQRKLNSLPNVEIILSATATEVLGNGSKVIGLVLKDRMSGALRPLEVAGIFVQIGSAPNTEWLGGALELTSRGEIAVEANGSTSIPGVFAAGDCTTVPYKQIVIAIGEGAKASLAAFDYLLRSTIELGRDAA